MTVLVQRLGGAPPYPAVVALWRGPAFLHSALVYDVGQGQRRCLHLAWHLALRDDPLQTLPKKAWWVSPAIDADSLEDVVTWAGLLACRYADGGVPYGFSLTNTNLAKDGTVLLRNGSGLTCASLIALIFKKAGVPLVDIKSWDQRSPARVEQDTVVQQLLVEHLQQDHPEQAALIAAEVGCTRLRPEEVAAATGMTPLPVDLPRVEPGAAQVLRVISL